MVIYSYDPNTVVPQKRLDDIKNSIVAFKMLVLCFTKAVEFIKCFNYVIIILIQNAPFDLANAGKENIAFVFVIGAVEYEMICFCF